MKTESNIRKIVLAIAVVGVLLVGWIAVPSAIARSASPSVQCLVELDKDVLYAGGPQKVIVKVTLDAPPPPERTDRPPVNLAIVLDRSGSMTGEKIEKAKLAAIEALRRLSPADMFSLVVYDHGVQTIVPAQSAANSEWIEGRIRKIQPGGNTALFGGVSQGAAEVRKHLPGNYVHRIILLSDGLANVGPSSPDDLGRLGAALLKEGISVTTIGVGTDYNEDLMVKLAMMSDGNTYFVESSVDLPRIFAAELGDVLSVVAKRVLLTIELPNGVRPLNIIGREGRITGRRVELSMNQLYGGQKKYALLEVEVPGSKAGEEKQIAKANVTYENAISQKAESARGLVNVRFSKDLAEVEKSSNTAVQKEYQLNRNALAQEEAISLADEGKNKEAVQELKQSAVELRAAGKRYQDAELLEKAEEMEAQAGRIESEGMTKKFRKALKTESYQTKTQQSEK